MDDYDDEYDEDGLYEDEEDEDLDESDLEDEDSLDDLEIEMAGSLDGEMDSNLGLADYAGFGSSVDLDSLSDEQKDMYEQSYLASKDITDFRNGRD